MSSFEINDLIDPKKFQDEIDITGEIKENLLSFLETMLLIRLTERCLAKGRKDGLIGGPVHLGVGQEAIATGISACLRNTDRIFGAHRSHAHALAQGASLQGLLSEVLGKDTGLSKGMGGSMHLWDQPNGFYGAVPIVGGTVPLAVGAGLAASLQGTSDIGIAYFGDGAIEEGVVQESLNLARMLKAPVLFVVENNLFASHMHISLRQPVTSTSRFASANDIPFEVIDGNDIVSLKNTANKLIDSIRSGDGPRFIEAITYRWYGHVDWREDIDVGVNRSQEDLIDWRKRDPISRLTNSLINNNILSKEDLSDIESRINENIQQAWQQALTDPYPSESSLLERVFSLAE